MPCTHMHKFTCVHVLALSYSPASPPVTAARIAGHIVPAAWHQSLLRIPLSGVVKRDPSRDAASRERKDSDPLFKRAALITASCAFLRRLLWRACRSVMRGWCIGTGGGVRAVDMRGGKGASCGAAGGRLLVSLGLTLKVF